MLRRVWILLLSGFPLAAVPSDSPASAEICGRCHRAIHEAWKKSAHARAMTNRVFQDAVALAAAEFGPGVRKSCLECHAPVASLTGDLELRDKVSWEGVTCDYCHSIQGVAIAAPNAKVAVQFSRVKSGPSQEAVSTAHGTSFSAVHTSSLACVACHEYRNALGFPVLATYSEWKESPAGKQGQHCQGCHMYRVAGHVVEPRVKRTSEARVNLHEMPGSHTLTQLNKTIKAGLSAAREGDQLKVLVTVVNQNAGHYVPTGSPLRQLVLQLKVDTFDGGRFQAERVYRRAVADRSGLALDREHFALVRAAQVLSDTRLAPEEKRTEDFSFPVPAGVPANVRAVFMYLYSPAPLTGAQERVTFLTISRFVR